MRTFLNLGAGRDCHCRSASIVREQTKRACRRSGFDGITKTVFPVRDILRFRRDRNSAPRSYRAISCSHQPVPRLRIYSYVSAPCGGQFSHVTLRDPKGGVTVSRVYNVEAPTCAAAYAVRTRMAVMFVRASKTACEDVETHSRHKS